MEDGFPFFREAVEALVPFILFAPLADQQTLDLEAAEQRVKSVLIDVETMIVERFSEGVAVVFVTEFGEDGEDEAATAQFEA